MSRLSASWNSSFAEWIWRVRGAIAETLGRACDVVAPRYVLPLFTFAELERAIRDSWSRDTADDDDWSPENPARGQCDITSLVVHDLLGGELLAADVFLDGERIEAHMWNRLPSGIEVDLTREQFRRGEVIGEPVTRPRPATFDPAHPRFHRYETYLVLSERVRERLRLSGTQRGV